MAKAKLAIGLEQIRGGLGNLVTKHYQDKRGTVLSQKPDMSRVKWSPAQLAQRERMRDVAGLYRTSERDPALRRRLEALARKHRINVNAAAWIEYARLEKLKQPAAARK